MSGFSRRRFWAIAALSVLCAGGAKSDDAAPVWTVSGHTRICPMNRLDEGASPVLWGEDRRSPVRVVPLPDNLMADPPTRAGFAGNDTFVCCRVGAADFETCEVADLETGTRRYVSLAQAEPDWLVALDTEQGWPFDDLQVRSTEVLRGGDTVSTVALTHPLADTALTLDEAVMKEAGALSVFDVKMSPDGSRLAVIRHGYSGEYTDFYPVSIFDTRRVVGETYDRAAQTLRRAAQDAEAMSERLKQR